MISVVITAYNNQPYLSKCIDSVITQTFNDIEIILVDDGSNDGTYEICEQYKRIDDRIRVFHIEHAGVTNARKYGVEKTFGEYISVIDGDDWLESEMLKKLYCAVKQHDADIAMCGRIEESEAGAREVRQGFEAGYYDKRLLNNVIYPHMIVNGDFFEWGIFPSLWDKLIKRSILIEAFGSDTEEFPMGNDAVIAYPAMLISDSVVITDECLYHYRQNNSSMVHNVEHDGSARLGFGRLYFAMVDKYAGTGYYDVIKTQWLKYLLFLMIPRADILYKGIGELDYLYPFPNVKKGCRVVIYCMGLFGRRVYEYLKATGFCEIVSVVDGAYESFDEKDIPVKDPAAVKDMEYDAIVIASSFAHVQKNIREYLEKYCPKEKIHVIDLNTALSEESISALGLVR